MSLGINNFISSEAIFSAKSADFSHENDGSLLGSKTSISQIFQENDRVCNVLFHFFRIISFSRLGLVD